MKESERPHLEDWKASQRGCEFREWVSFGHYNCNHKDATKSFCPRSRYELCPLFKASMEKKN